MQAFQPITVVQDDHNGRDKDGCFEMAPADALPHTCCVDKLQTAFWIYHRTEIIGICILDIDRLLITLLPVFFFFSIEKDNSILNLPGTIRFDIFCLKSAHRSYTSNKTLLFFENGYVW